MNRVDQAIAAIKYTLNKRQLRVDQLNKRTDLTEQQRQYILEEMDLKQHITILIEEVKTDYKKTLGKLPPQDKDLEIRVLGTVIFENPAFDIAKKFLRPEHFYIRNHEIIWAAALQAGKDQPIEIMNVISYLRRTGELETVGGLQAVIELTGYAGTVQNIAMHGRVLIEKAIKRELILMVGNVMDAAYRDDSDCFEVLDKAKEEIKKVEDWIK